ncbi:MAG: hypothetical protein WBF88_17635 [Pusillimonas sp.]
MKHNDGGPAFPFGQTDAESGQLVNGWGGEGMTLRDYFAAKAMTRIIAHDKDGCMSPDITAMAAYSLADAMLKARSQP